MWREKALCKGSQPDFYLDQGGTQRKKINKAKAICNVCPVIDDCLDFIKKDQDHYGIWAGLTPKERKGKGWWKVSNETTTNY